VLSKEYVQLKSLNLQQGAHSKLFPVDPTTKKPRFYTFDEWLWAACAWRSRSLPRECVFPKKFSSADTPKSFKELEHTPRIMVPGE